jgi:hypothetical protein
MSVEGFDDLGGGAAAFVVVASFLVCLPCDSDLPFAEGEGNPCSRYVGYPVGSANLLTRRDADGGVGVPAPLRVTFSGSPARELNVLSVRGDREAPAVRGGTACVEPPVVAGLHLIPQAS